jgi:hypothetical protein
MRFGISLLRRLQIERIDRHHLDRRAETRLRRYEDHCGDAVVSREGQSLDQFLVRDHLVFAGRQSSINSLQSEGMKEDHCFPRCSRHHTQNSRAMRRRLHGRRHPLASQVEKMSPKLRVLGQLGKPNAFTYQPDRSACRACSGPGRQGLPPRRRPRTTSTPSAHRYERTFHLDARWNAASAPAKDLGEAGPKRSIQHRTVS